MSPSAPDAAFGVPGNGIDVTTPWLSIVEPMARKAKRDALQLSALDGDNQAAQAATDTETQILARRGKDALDNSDLLADYDKRTNEIEKSLPDDVKFSFRQSASAKRQSLYALGERHGSAQHEEYDRDTTAAALDLRTSNALANYADPQQRESAIEQSRAILKDFGARQGWSPDVTEQKTATQLSRIHSGVIERYLNSGNDLSAADYYKTAQPQMTGEDQAHTDKLLEIGSTLGAAQRSSDDILSGRFAPGSVEAGNIDLTKRPIVKNADGTISTVRSISIGEDGHTVLIPTVVGGKVVSDEQAIKYYEDTGEHLGKFKDEASANAYAQGLHETQARYAAGQAPVDISSALAQAATITNPRIREATERQIRQHYEDLAFADRQDRDAAFDQAKEIVRGNGGDYTKVPPAVLNRLNTTQEEEIRRIGRNIRYPDNITDEAKYTHLLNFASVSPTAFLDIDLRKQYGDDLSRNDLEHVEALQRKIREQQNRAETTGDNRLKRAEEKTVIDAAKTAAKVSDNLKSLPPGVANYLPKPKSVTVPQWMIDSARTNKPYADYLRLHGVNLDQPTATQQQPTSPSVPGAPIGRPGPIDLTKVP